jgi:integrase
VRHRATGHVRVIPRKDGDVFYAKMKLPDGTEPQRRLGRVWTKRTRPPDGYLTRGMAEARLAAILAGDDPLVNIAPSHVTFGQACDEYMRYLRDDRQRKRSTVADARSTIKVHLLPALGESTPVEEITTADIDRLCARLLDGKRSHRTVQKTMILLHGVLSRAKRKGWLTTNPAENAEKVTVTRSAAFNVLTVEQVHAVARASDSDLLAAMTITAAFTGLRQGELLALRWRHVDFANRIVHVTANYVRGQEDTPKSHRARSVPLSDQALVALDGLSRRAHFTGPDDLVFSSTVGGRLLDDDVRDAFYAALDAAGLGHLREGGPHRVPRPQAYLRHAGRTHRARDGRAAVARARGRADDHEVCALRPPARQRRQADRRVRRPDRRVGRGADASVTAYHRTTADSAGTIIRDGFRDAEGTYYMRNAQRGVWVTLERPWDLTISGEPPGDPALLVIEVPDDEIVAYEWIEEGKGYREALVPAEVLNKWPVYRGLECDECGAIAREGTAGWRVEDVDTPLQRRLRVTTCPRCVPPDVPRTPVIL